MAEHPPTLKTVKYIIPAYDVDMGGVKVKQALSTQQVVPVDPFVLNTTTQIIEAMRDHPMGKMGFHVEEK